VFAWTVANDKPHELAEPFTMERFYTGHLVDEHGAAGVAH
jgi:sarcosine oxidase subunit beta